METADKFESWSIGNGAVTCMLQASADPTTIDTLLRRPIELVEHLDPVLRDAMGRATDPDRSRP
jgi:hypothetical protein